MAEAVASVATSLVQPKGTRHGMALELFKESPQCALLTARQRLQVHSFLGASNQTTESFIAGDGEMRQLLIDDAMSVKFYFNETNE